MAKINFKGLNKEKLNNLLNLDIKELSKKLKKKNTSNKVKKHKVFNSKVVSLDIGSENIKIALGRYNKEKLVIDNLISIKTPEDSILDGKINNALAIQNVIEEALSNNGVKTRDGICTTNSTLIINRDIIIPKVEVDEEETLINFEIQRYLPLNMNDYIVQHSIIDNMVIDNQNKSKALVITYPEKIAKSYYNLLSNLKLKPRALDVTYNSLNKLVVYADSINGKEYSVQASTAFIDMGANSLNVNIYNNGKLEFTRIIKSGGNNIDFELAKIMGKPIKEAEKYKKENIDISIISENEHRETSIVKEVVNSWNEELERILQFYKNKELGNSIDKIYIYGGTSKLKGIEQYVKDKFMISVEKIDTINNIEFNNKLVGQSIEDYLNALGAIIRR